VRSDKMRVGGPHFYTLSIALTDPMGVGPAVVSPDWLALASV
jgi:hypothetical protein